MSIPKSKPRGEVARVFFMVDGEPQKEPSSEATAILWRFADDSTIEVPLASVPTPMLKCAALFGLKTKLRNAYADAQGLKAARAGLDAALTALRSGEWNGAERASVNFALLPDALVAIGLAATREAAETMVAQRDGEDAAAFRKRLTTICSEPRIAKALVDLKPKGAEVDLTALLG